MEKKFTREKENQSSLCQNIFVQETYVGGTCNLCVHEHENWGDNEHCKNCENKHKN